MSYDIDLIADDGTVLPTENFREGGTFNMFGTNRCELNVTYNYAQVLSILDFSMHDLAGQTAEASLPRLLEVRKGLGGDKDNPPRPWEQDYWAPTPGNALAAIERLIAFAEEHPSGIWAVT